MASASFEAIKINRVSNDYYAFFGVRIEGNIEQFTKEILIVTVITSTRLTFDSSFA